MRQLDIRQVNGRFHFSVSVEPWVCLLMTREWRLHIGVYKHMSESITCYRRAMLISWLEKSTRVVILNQDRTMTGEFAEMYMSNLI